MSDKKETKKKGFFSRLFSGSDSIDASKELETKVVEEDSTPLSKAEKVSPPSVADNSVNTITESVTTKVATLSKSALSKMKKADIVATAAELGLELDVKLTKDKLLEAWNTHFNRKEDIQNIKDEPVAEEVAEEPVAEEVAEEPVAEEVAEEPVAEEVAEEPVAEEVAEEPVAEDETHSKPITIDEQSPAQIINTFESKQLKDDIPPFRPGDTVVVSVKVKEGDRVRLQAFEGVVMNIKNAGLNSAFIVRKISSGIGVERTFQLHSPMIDSITVKRKGDVRQAKLYYLRERSGRSARIKERLD